MGETEEGSRRGAGPGEAVLGLDGIAEQMVATDASDIECTRGRVVRVQPEKHEDRPGGAAGEVEAAVVLDLAAEAAHRPRQVGQ